MKHSPLFRRCGKKALAVVASATLLVSMMPASAFALGDISQWSATKVMPTSYVKDGKTYTYITSAAHRRTEAVADYLGISNVTVDPTRTGKAFDYAASADVLYKQLSQLARFGIFGTGVNVNPNPYYANYYHNVYENYIGGSNFANADDTILLFTGNTAPMAADTTIVDSYGTSMALYYRPDILLGSGEITDGTTNADGEENKVLVGQAASTKSGYSELVEKIRNKELGEYDGVSLYKQGDENYNPYYVNVYGYSQYNVNEPVTLYNMATAAEEIIEETAKTDNPRVARYGSPMAIAQNYEEFCLATQYEVLKAIDEGKVSKRTVGIVASIDNETGDIKFENSASASKPWMKVLRNTTTSITEGLGEDMVGSASDLMKCDCIMLSDVKAKDSLVEALQSAGYTDESKYPEIFTTAPDPALMVGNGECENAFAYAYYLGFVYPEVINPVHGVAYYYETFYHTKASALEDVLGMQASNMSLPQGIDMSLDGYSSEAFKASLDEGLQYFVDNRKTIEANDVDDTLTPTDYLPLPAKGAASQAITTAQDSWSKTYSKATFNLGAKAKTALSYKSSNSKVATVSSSGTVTLKGAGTCTITVSAAASADYAATAKAITVKVSRASQKVTAKVSKKTLKAKKLKKKAATFSIGAKAKTPVTYKSSTKRITVSKAGKVKVKKGIKKGSYKVTVKAAKTAQYNAASKTIRIVVK